MTRKAVNKTSFVDEIHEFIEKANRECMEDAPNFMVYNVMTANATMASAQLIAFLCDKVDVLCREIEELRNDINNGREMEKDNKSKRDLVLDAIESMEILDGFEDKAKLIVKVKEIYNG